MNILVFDIGGTAVKYGLCCDDKLLWHKESPTNAKLGGRYVLDRVIEIAKGIEEPFSAIGISTAGQVDHKEGRIIYANENIPGYTGMEIRKELEEMFRVPVAVENDVNSAAIGEAAFGAGREEGDFLCLTYGTGIGGAIVIDKEIYHGSSSSAAEFGAIVTHAEEKLKGKDPFDGCYEAYASTTALVKMASAYDAGLTDGRKIFARADEAAIENIVKAWVDEILLGLSTLIHIFNPSCIVLGGGVMTNDMVTELINGNLHRFIMPSYSHVRIVKAELGNTAGLMGAGFLAKRQAELQPLPEEELVAPEYR